MGLILHLFVVSTCIAVIQCVPVDEFTTFQKASIGEPVIPAEPNSASKEDDSKESNESYLNNRPVRDYSSTHTPQILAGQAQDVQQTTSSTHKPQLLGQSSGRLTRQVQQTTSSTHKPQLLGQLAGRATRQVQQTTSSTHKPQLLGQSSGRLTRQVQQTTSSTHKPQLLGQLAGRATRQVQQTTSSTHKPQLLGQPQFGSRP